MPNRKKSVFKSIFLESTLLSMLLVFVTFLTFSVLIAHHLKKNEVESRQRLLDAYVGTVQKEIETVMQKTSFVLQNNNLAIRLVEDYRGGNMNMYEFITETASYLDMFVMGSSISEFVIYVPNETIYENKYIAHADKLREYDRISERLLESDGVLWGELASMPDGNEYFTVYRNFIIKDSGIIKITFQKPVTEDGIHYYIGISERETEETEGRRVLKQSINDSLFAYTVVEAKDLRKYDYLVFALMLAGFLLISVIYVGISDFLYKRTIANISGFILSLEKSNYVITDEELASLPDDSTELHAIKLSLNRLKKELKRNTELYFANEFERKKLRLSLLQSKIDPHLLYNSLSYLNLCAGKYHDEKIIELISTISDYYRRVLSKGKDVTTLAEEIEMIRLYLRVVEISQRLSIEFIVHTPKELQSITIPHLLLQPFIENSVKHGLSGMSEGKIEFKAEKKGEHITISIIDNGFGIKEDELLRLNNIRNEIYDCKRGYGIFNAYERLLLYYGEKNTEIRFSNRETGGVEVVIGFDLSPGNQEDSEGFGNDSL